MASRVVSGLMVAAIVAVGASTSQAQQKELSDHSVAVLMDYAWTILPALFRGPNGKVIEVDKKTKTREELTVPVDVGREVIKVGYVSAQAQLCDMLEEQLMNYDALMSREIAKKKWSDQQLLYISTLHRMTIHMAAGKLRVIEKGPDEIQVIQEPLEPSKEVCPDDKRKRVKEAVAAYVAGSPGPIRKASPDPAPDKPAAVQPTSAKDKKDKK